MDELTPPPQNPYASPKHAGPLSASSVDDDEERIRNEHISHEASIKSVGLLFVLGGSLGIVASLFFLSDALISLLNPGPPVSSEGGSVFVWVAIFGLVITPLSVLQLVSGMGLRKLAGWAALPGTMIAAVGLLGFPFGTVICAYIIYLLNSRKGKTVFSQEYKEIIANTPHIKNRTSIVVWIFLGLILALIGINLFLTLIG